MTPAEWLSNLRKAVNEKDWNTVSLINKNVKQVLANNGKPDEIVSFFEHALNEVATSETYKKVRINDLSLFEESLRKVFKQGLDRAFSDASITALYFEYFFDGGDACEGTLFLCSAYSEDDDYWAAEFGSDGDIRGPSVFDYLNYDPGLDFEPVLSEVAEAYADATLMASCIRILNELGVSNSYPFGFAKHDAPIVRIPKA